MEAEQLAALSERTPSEELASRLPSFELEFSHEQLEHLEECSRGVVFYGGADDPSGEDGADSRGAQTAARGGAEQQSSGPLYQRQYHSASVLVCDIPVRAALLCGQRQESSSVGWLLRQDAGMLAPPLLLLPSCNLGAVSTGPGIFRASVGCCVPLRSERGSIMTFVLQ